MSAKMASALAFIFALQGCTALNVELLRPKDVVDKNLDDVLFDFKKQGLNCGAEYKTQTAGLKQVSIGGVVCSGGDVGLICPETKLVTVFFDLVTRKVIGLGKSSKTNCF